MFILVLNTLFAFATTKSIICKTFKLPYAGKLMPEKIFQQQHLVPASFSTTKVVKKRKETLTKRQKYLRFIKYSKKEIPCSHIT